jgi:predicted MFS family arabinose efflux permease
MSGLSASLLSRGAPMSLTTPATRVYRDLVSSDRPPGRHRNTDFVQPRRARYRSAWGTLHNPDFRLYFAGSLVSNVGTWFQNTAQVLLAYQLTHSVFIVGLVTCAQFSGSLLLGPWAAVVAGRIGGKRMLICTQVLSALVAGTIAYLEWTGHLGELPLVAGALSVGVLFAFALPIQTALVPKLVPEADSEAAVTMNSVSYNAGRAVAPAICVVVIITIGFAWAFAFNAISFLMFAAFLTRVLPRPSGTRVERTRAREGLVEALMRPRIMLILAMVAAVTLADDPILTLGPALAHHLPGASNNWAGYFLSALGCGTIAGSLWPPRKARRLSNSYSSRRAAWSLLLLAVAIAVFASGVSRWLSLMAAFGAGVAALLTGAVTQTQLMRQQPQRIASVMALWAIAWAGTKPLASLLDGSLASAFGRGWAVAVLILPAVALALAEICLTRAQAQRLSDFGRRWGNRLGKRVAAGTFHPRVQPVDPVEQQARPTSPAP